MLGIFHSERWGTLSTCFPRAYWLQNRVFSSYNRYNVNNIDQHPIFSRNMPFFYSDRYKTHSSTINVHFSTTLSESSGRSSLLTLVPCNQRFTSQSLVIVRILPQDITNILARYPDTVSWSGILIRYPDHIQLIKNQDTKSGYGLRISPITIVPKNITVGYPDSNGYIFF